MKIRDKTVLVICITIPSVLALNGEVSRGVLMSSHCELETKNSARDEVVVNVSDSGVAITDSPP